MNKNDTEKENKIKEIKRPKSVFGQNRRALED